MALLVDSAANSGGIHVGPHYARQIIILISFVVFFLPLECLRELQIEDGVFLSLEEVLIDA